MNIYIYIFTFIFVGKEKEKEKKEESKGIGNFFKSLIGSESKDKENNNENKNENLNSNNNNTNTNNTTTNSNSNNNNNAKDNSEGFFSKLNKMVKRDNVELMNKFVRNMHYNIKVEQFFKDIFSWKSYPTTITSLFIITLIILYPIMGIILSPLILILVHFCFRDTLTNLSLKNKDFNSLDGMNFICNFMDKVNSTISIFEEIIEELSKAEGILAEEIYFELIKMSCWGFVLYLGKCLFIHDIQIVLVYLLWIASLLANTNIMIFALYMNKLITKRILIPMIDLTGALLPKLFSTITNKGSLVINSILKSLPLYTLILKIKQEKLLKLQNQNQSKIGSSFSLSLFDKEESKNTEINESFKVKEIVSTLKSAAMDNQGILTNQSSIENPFLSLDICKFEIYENERWWMIVGWAKNLVLNEAPLWSDSTYQFYMDKTTVVIPSSNYSWETDWKIEFTVKSDDQGWEYGNDFKSEFTSDSFGKYVRRRKWVRVAKKKTSPNSTTEKTEKADVVVGSKGKEKKD